MRVKNRTLTYDTKYEHEGWLPHISRTNGKTFRLVNKETGHYFSEYSDDSFLDAEEKVEKQFSTFMSCQNHEYKRLYITSKTGVCVKCKVKVPNAFESPFNCVHEDCDELADFVIHEIDETTDRHFCFNHYMIRLSELTKGWLENGFPSNLERYEQEYEYDLTFKYKVLKALDSRNKLEHLSLNEKEVLNDSLRKVYKILRINFLVDLGELKGQTVNNGSVWEFMAAITIDDIDFFVYEHLKDKIDLHEEELQCYENQKQKLLKKAEKILK